MTVAQLYETTDMSLREVFEALSKPLSQVNQATLDLLQQQIDFKTDSNRFNNREFLEFQNSILKCDSSKYTLEELFFFLVHCGFYSLPRKLMLNAESIFQRLNAFGTLKKESTHVLFKMYESEIYAWSKNDFRQQLKISRELFEQTDPHSRFYPLVANNHLSNLYNQNKIKDVKIILSHLSHSNNDQISFVRDFFNFYHGCKNNSLTGVGKTVSDLENGLLQVKKIRIEHFLNGIAVGLYWLNIFNPIDKKVLEKYYPYLDFENDWSFKIVQDLLNNKPEEAWEKSKKFINEGYFHMNYAVLRAAITLKKTLTAKKILKTYLKTRDASYIDNFFMARICLLDGKRDEAMNLFHKAFRYARDNDCLGSLKCELKMAYEMNPLDLFDLGEKLNSKRSKINLMTSKITKKVNQSGDQNLLLGTGRWFEHLEQDIDIYAQTDHPILIRGETGSGKEVVAHQLHKRSLQKNKPFISINCGGLSVTLLESELFGHVRGAFTGAISDRKGLIETASDGTIFLDEIGDLPTELQVSLLRVIENREFKPVGGSKFRKVKCRIICASNIDFEKALRFKKFRKDLYYRISALEIYLPPLRQRRSDIIMLAQYFLALNHPQADLVSLSDDLKQHLSRYDWPGNVRELKNEIEYMKIMNQDILEYDLKDLRDSFYRKITLENHAINQFDANDHQTHDINHSNQVDQNHLQPLFTGRLSRIERRDYVRKLFHQHKSLTRLKVCQLLGVSPMTVSNDFKQLENEGLIKKVCPSKSTRTHYFVLKQ